MKKKNLKKIRIIIIITALLVLVFAILIPVIAEKLKNNQVLEFNKNFVELSENLNKDNFVDHFSQEDTYLIYEDMKENYEDACLYDLTKRDALRIVLKKKIDIIEKAFKDVEIWENYTEKEKEQIINLIGLDNFTSKSYIKFY